jgi:hypothetical protein
MISSTVFNNLMDQSRQNSLTIEDLETMSQCQTGVDLYDMYLENKQIFDDICQDVEAEDELLLVKQGCINRRSSIPFSSFAVDKTPNTSRRARRHSTFNSRNRMEHHDAHTNMKEWFISMNDVDYERRSNFVNNLVELNLRYGTAMSASKYEVSRTMDAPYPIFNYMNDDEDSVGIAMNKQSSLIYPSELKEKNDWETLNDTFSTDTFCIEYAIEMPQIEKPVLSLERNVRKPHSYKMLERRFSSESSVSAIKSFIAEEMTKFHQSSTALSTDTKPIKGYNNGGFPAYSVQSPFMSKQQCARGA